ncbi:MAG: creatininase family protein [Acidobacteriota bacterium]
MRTIRMEDMNWPDIRRAVDDGFTTVVVGIGSTEQHGPHLPTSTDTLIGEALAYRVASRLGDALQARTIALGCSDHHLAFPGTISLRAETLGMIIEDYARSLSKHGFKRVVLLPSHGGNFFTVKKTIERLRPMFPHLHITGCTDLMAVFGVLARASGEFGISAEDSGAHAGESETSILLALAEDLVAQDRLAAGYVGPLGPEQVDLLMQKGMTSLTENGVLGDPAKASADKGLAYLDRLVDYLLEEIRQAPSE